MDLYTHLNTNYRRNKMSDGKDLKGFNDVKPVTTTSWSGEQYAADPASAFPSTDKSTQDGSGVGNNGK
jgi:hypothetical protein